MTHLPVAEWGRCTVGDGGFTRIQANALMAAARAHPRGGRDGTDILCDHHGYLRARQMVGVLAAPGCSLEILPKVDPEAPDDDVRTVRQQLVHMLDVAFGLNVSTGSSATMAHDAESLLEVFITAFADRLLAEVRRGLPRHYREHREDLRALRGRLDVVRQFTVNAVRPDRLACEFDTLEADGPLLQVMKACVLLVERHARAPETLRKLVELRFLLADVREVPRAMLPWRAIRIDRSNLRWRALLDLARLLLGGAWQQTHADARGAAGITLLFPMHELFERYVAVQLRHALSGSGLEVVTQGGFRHALGPWVEGIDCEGDSHSTRPDILVQNHDGKVLAVIDTKWKRFADGIAQADAYQMMAYARLYRCPRVILLYPAGPRDTVRKTRSHGISQGRERLDAACVAVDRGERHARGMLRDLLRDIVPEGDVARGWSG